MALETLKNRLIHRIQEIEDEQAIRKIFSYIENMQEEPVSPVEMEHSELLAIVQAEDDVVEGRLIREEDAEKQVKKWL
ncbi:hypothetical protein [Rhodohalobacter mucosus]|uniref:Addiction module component n=1 Tax=Rhodohalobacter mucosus TaxID=2079485 RepID=A0A316TNY7_9BACT|nr:hypothetical protein [Rhodohalobacter mucosus]PWN05371.1 hypothetical protein DDZ15_14995 [Rhodohalobacter mucosus]